MPSKEYAITYVKLLAILVACGKVDRQDAEIEIKRIAQTYEGVK